MKKEIFPYTYKILIIAIGVILVVVMAVLVRKMYVKNNWINQYLTEIHQETNNLYEAYGLKETKISLKSDKPVRVLCLGNSITLHTIGRTRPGADPFWEGHWGMCASRPDSDYVHRLQKYMLLHCPQSTVIGINIATWEANPLCNKDSLIGAYIKDKDLIIIRLGENVVNDSLFAAEFPNLISYCELYTKNIIITGMYWKNTRREHVFIQASREFNLPYVPLYWIYDNYQDVVKAHVGDTIYNVKGEPYTIKTDFITTHPNDYGMKLIADAISQKIKF
jgi:hypothetical protein